METIDWAESYSIGNALLDQQHKLLFEITNTLIVTKGSYVHSKLISKLLDDLIYYAQVHFSTEEAYMRLHNFPDSDEHINDHNQFILKAENLRALAMTEEKNLPDLTLDSCLDWLQHHILEEDMSYRFFVEGKNEWRNRAPMQEPREPSYQHIPP